jgi:ADP-ribose pyrophosphatase
MTRAVPRHRPWKVLSRREVYASPPWIRVDAQRVLLPDGRVVEPFHRVYLPDFALVVASAPDGRIAMLRQYRHGTGRVGLHVPGGFLKRGEAPLAAAKRELMEETGCVAAGWRSLGSHVCNANLGCGRAHLFAARGAREVAAPDPGDLEEQELVWLTQAEAAAALARGAVDSLASAAALALALTQNTETRRARRRHGG